MSQIIAVAAILLFGSYRAMAFAGSATCHYELYTPEHFAKPVITSPFKVDLSKTEDISIEDSSIQRIIRLRTKAATIDGRALTHVSFSQTYDGAHSGAIVPAANGTYVMILSKDGSDLIAAYLFCDVQVNLTTKKLPSFPKVHCVNVREGSPYREIKFVLYDGIRRYLGEIIKKDVSDNETSESLGESELYVFRDNFVTIAGLGAVVEFQLPDSSGAATPAEVRMNNPRYESSSWLCKTMI